MYNYENQSLGNWLCCNQHWTGKIQFITQTAIMEQFSHSIKLITPIMEKVYAIKCHTWKRKCTGYDKANYHKHIIEKYISRQWRTEMLSFQQGNTFHAWIICHLDASDSCENFDSDNNEEWSEADCMILGWGTDWQGQTNETEKWRWKIVNFKKCINCWVALRWVKYYPTLEQQNILFSDKLVLCKLRTTRKKKVVCNFKANYIIFFQIISHFKLSVLVLPSIITDNWVYCTQNHHFWCFCTLFLYVAYNSIK